jgi:hypothetical protein
MCAIRRVNEAHSKLQLKSVSVDEIMILLCPNGQYICKKKKAEQISPSNSEASYHQNMSGETLAVRRRAACPHQSYL